MGVELTEITVMLFQKALQASLMRTSQRNMGAGATKKSKDVWKQSSFIAVPIVIIGTSLFVYRREQAHAAHYHRNEWKEWPHLSIRNKNYAWGNGKRSLFHDPAVNGIVGKGYEAPPHGGH